MSWQTGKGPQVDNKDDKLLASSSPSSWKQKLGSLKERPSRHLLLSEGSLRAEWSRLDHDTSTQSSGPISFLFFIYIDQLYKLWGKALHSSLVKTLTTPGLQNRSDFSFLTPPTFQGRSLPLFVYVCMCLYVSVWMCMYICFFTLIKVVFICSLYLLCLRFSVILPVMLEIFLTAS